MIKYTELDRNKRIYRLFCVEVCGPFSRYHLINILSRRHFIYHEDELFKLLLNKECYVIGAELVNNSIKIDSSIVNIDIEKEEQNDIGRFIATIMATDSSIMIIEADLYMANTRYVNFRVREVNNKMVRNCGINRLAVYFDSEDRKRFEKQIGLMGLLEKNGVNIDDYFGFHINGPTSRDIVVPYGIKSLHLSNVNMQGIYNILLPDTCEVISGIMIFDIGFMIEHINLNNVTSLLDGAFSGAVVKNLEFNRELEIISGFAFSRCRINNIQGKIKTNNIKESAFSRLGAHELDMRECAVDNFKRATFNNCELHKLIMPDTLTAFCADAFEDSDIKVMEFSGKFEMAFHSDIKLDGTVLWLDQKQKGAVMDELETCFERVVVRS